MEIGYYFQDEVTLNENSFNYYLEINKQIRIAYAFEFILFTLESLIKIQLDGSYF